MLVHFVNDVKCYIDNILTLTFLSMVSFIIEFLMGSDLGSLLMRPVGKEVSKEVVDMFCCPLYHRAKQLYGKDAYRHAGPPTPPLHRERQPWEGTPIAV